MKFWFKINASEKSDEPVEIIISDVIGDDWESATAKDFISQIKSYKGRHLNVRINSPGGSVFDGLAIYNYLKQRGNVTTIIDGIAASIASVVALAGERVVMGAGTFFMIHNPWSFAVGEADEMRKTANVLDKIADEIADIYAKATGATIEKIKEWMDAETWFTAAEAVENKFATEMVNVTPARASFSLSKFHKTPPAALALLEKERRVEKPLSAAQPAVQAASNSTAKHKSTSTQRKKVMKTLQQLISARGAAIKKIDALKNKERDGTISEDEVATLAALRAEVSELDDQIKTEKQDAAARNEQAKLEAEANAQGSRAEVPFNIGSERKTEQEQINNYSFKNALQASAKMQPLVGFEKEMHDQGVKELKSLGQSDNGGVVIPQFVLERARIHKINNAQTATGGTDGSEGGVNVQTSVGTPLMYLAERLVFVKLGAKFRTGLVGNLSIPTIARDDQAQEKAETATANESDPEWGSVLYRARRLPVGTKVSRQLLLQSENNINEILSANLFSQIARRMERGGISGDGSSNAPIGILNTTGVGLYALGANGAAPNWKMIVELEGLVAKENADVGNLAYLTNSDVRKILKETLKPSSTASQFIWNENTPTTPLNGYAAEVTNLVPGDLTKGTGTDLSAIIFGDFSQCGFGQWGGMELLADPYTSAGDGIINLSAWTFYDFNVERPESFAACKDIITV